jgi:hypothetical protein
MIINIEPGTFGTVRNGDMIGVANVLEHIRKINNNPMIQFHLKPGNVSSDTHCQTFYEIMLKMTNYFSTEPGEQSLPWRKVNVWDFRDISGDLVKIPNNAPMEKRLLYFHYLMHHTINGVTGQRMYMNRLLPNILPKNIKIMKK